MTEIIFAFSSDSRSLYKADVFKTLALPEGYVLHFRYDEKYVEDILISRFKNYENFVGKKACIFFTKGNSGSNKFLKNIPIRWAEVVSLERSADTNFFHIYFKLLEYADIDSGFIEDGKSPVHSKYLSIGYIEGQKYSDWRSRVELLKESYEGYIFYKIKKIKGLCGEVRLSYRGDRKNCYYNLVQGARYEMEMSFANPGSNKSSIVLKDATDSSVVNIISPYHCSARYDDISVAISVKTLPTFCQHSFISLDLSNSDPKIDSVEYKNNIEVAFVKGVFRPAIFGLCTVIAAISIAFMAKNGVENFTLETYHIISIIAIFISSSILFGFFDKK